VAAPGFELYLITDGAGGEMVAAVERALAGVGRGRAGVQLRAKTLGGRALLEAARALRQVTEKAGAALIINDRVDVALAAGADGAHLPSRGLPVKPARRVAGRLLLGASTHSLDEARMAAAGGADFVTFGPVWATPSKAGMGEPVGAAALAETAAALAVPVFALGGVTVENAGEVAACGARPACIRAVLAATDPGAAAARLLDAWQAAKRP